jgi:hypothetical protein
MDHLGKVERAEMELMLETNVTSQTNELTGFAAHVLL